MILCILIVLLTATSAYCQDEILCPKLDEEHYPALLYVEYFSDRQQLNIAYWDQDYFAVQELFYGNRVSIRQVGDDLFYVSGANLRNLNNKYILDVRNGTGTKIENEKFLQYLGMIPSHSVMLLHTGLNNNFITYYRYYLHTHKLEVVSQFLKENNKTRLKGVVSPDLQYVASFQYMGENDDIHPKPAQYKLSITNIITHKTTVIDNEVGIVISSVSSFRRGHPPYVWLSENELMYLDMDMKQTSYWDFETSKMIKDTSSTLKIANISQPDITVTSCGDYDLPLTLSGGAFHLAGDQIYYEDLWEVDKTSKTIVKRLVPYEINADKNNGQVTIYWHENKLYPVKGNFWQQPLLSPSQDFLAYTTTQKKSAHDRRRSAYVKQYGTEEPFLLDDSAGRYTRFIAWIE